MSSTHIQRWSDAPRTLSLPIGQSVPGVVEAYVTLVMKQAAEQLESQDEELFLSRLQNEFRVHHLTREGFEAAFLMKRAAPAEVKIDDETDRVYLVGIGLPGREELELQDRAFYNQHGEVAGRELLTLSDTVDSTVLCYTEITWHDMRRAADKVEEMPRRKKMALCEYFDIGLNHLHGTLLALDSLSDTEIDDIARHTVVHGGGQ